mgnify:CR=1 FL=1
MQLAYKDGCKNKQKKTGQKSFFCISGRARKFWTALIERALQKQNKKGKTR